MPLSKLIFASPEFLQLVEGHGVTGTWNWLFATNEQFWSPGLYRLLGLQPGERTPSYDLFLSRVHPDDRHRVANAAHFIDGVVFPETAIRVMHRDGTMRSLSVRYDIYFASDGRPIAAGGSMLDVTDRERQAEERVAYRRRQMALYQRAGLITFSIAPDFTSDLSPELAAYVGRPLDDLIRDPLWPIASANRAEFEDRSASANSRNSVFRMQPQFQRAHRGLERVNSVRVPIQDEASNLVEWRIFIYPLRGIGAVAADALWEGVEHSVKGHHLRAARALLDWSMRELAEASGMSLSTVKRLEEDAESHSVASRQKAVASLRAAGVRFAVLDDGALAVSRI